MKLAIMQPYLFPYIGYFQLINAVDKFVVYDDVNFIKQGWINRNYILLNGQKFLFSIPIKHISSYRLISETKINRVIFRKQKKKLIKTINQFYNKSPFFKFVFPIFQEVLNTKSDLIVDFAFKSIVLTMKYLGIETFMQKSSKTYNDRNLSAADRVIDICKIEKADCYINPQGGMNLYKKEDFLKDKIDLKFLKTNENLSKLSILHYLMNYSVSDIQSYLKEFKLL